MNTNLQGCGGSLEGRWGPFHEFRRDCQESRFGFVLLRIPCESVPRTHTATNIAKDRNARRIGLTQFVPRHTQILPAKRAARNAPVSTQSFQLRCCEESTCRIVRELKLRCNCRIRTDSIERVNLEHPCSSLWTIACAHPECLFFVEQQ